MAALVAAGLDPGTTRPRSVIAGRQRWDVRVVLGHVRLAQLLESELIKYPGIELVRANPVTGRVLVIHDIARTSGEIGQQIEQSVRLVVAQACVPPATASTAPPEALSVTASRPDGVGQTLTLADAGAAVLIVVGLISGSPIARMGAVLVATAAVIGRAWRRSSRRQQDSAGPGRSTRHPILTVVGSHKRRFYLATALSVLGELSEMAPAIFIGWMLLVAVSGPSSTLVGLGIASALGQLVFLAAMTGVVFLTYAGVSLLAEIQWRDLAQTVQQEWRNEMFARVQAAEMQCLEGERATRLARVLIDDIDQLGRFLANSANELVQMGTTIVVLVPAFLFLAPGIAWIALLPVPIITWLSFFYQEHAAPGYRVGRETASQLNSHLINNLEAAATVKSFGAQDFEIACVRRLGDEHREGNRQVDIRTAAYRQTIMVCTGASLVGILLFGGVGVLTGALAIPVYQVLILLPRIFFARLPRLGDAVEQYERSVASLRRVLELVELPPEPGGSGRPLDVAAVEGTMVLEAVTFAYRDRSPVLQDLTLQISAKKTTGIVGVTGAGKTTIAKLLLRLEDVDSGRVLLDGVDIREIRIEDLRTAIGFVAQDAFMFDGTVADNIRYGTFDADDKRVADGARLAEANGFVEALPDQYDTMVGERGVTLSGGQRQRISLARAIVKRAPILILDEATSAVDNETEAAIQHALADFARDRTLVIIAHRLSTIRHADWIYVLGSGGVIVEQGQHHQLLELRGVYAAMWNLQVGEGSG
jgi:ATP-binding cassette, subfamily B, bacterial